MSKIIYIQSNSKKLLYIINTEEFNNANNFFKNIKLLNPELELNEVFTMNDRMLLYPIFRHEENKFIIYHGDSNSNKNYKKEKEKIPHLKIINKTGVIEFFLPLPTYSKYHLDRAIELFLSDNPNHKIVVDEVTNNKYIQNNSNFNPISNPISNTNYNQFVTLGYGLGIVVNALQQTQPLRSEPPLLMSRLSSRPRPLPPPSPPSPPSPSLSPYPYPYSRLKSRSEVLHLHSHPYSRSRPESPPPLQLYSRSRPRSRSRSRPRSQQPTNYFSQQNKVLPVPSTKELLALNLLNEVNEFNQNNRPQLQTVQSVQLVQSVQSDKLNLQNYSDEFLSQIFNSTKEPELSQNNNYKLLSTCVNNVESYKSELFRPSSPSWRPSSPSWAPSSSPPPYVPKQALD